MNSPLELISVHSGIESKLMRLGMRFLASPFLSAEFRIVLDALLFLSISLKVAVTKIKIWELEIQTIL